MTNLQAVQGTPPDVHSHNGHSAPGSRSTEILSYIGFLNRTTNGPHGFSNQTCALVREICGRS